MKSILVPLDGSPLSAQALPYARLLARSFGAALTLLHVLPEAERYEMVFEREALQEFGRSTGALSVQRQPNDAALREQAEDYLETQARPLRDAGLAVMTMVAFGWPAETIVQHARDFEVDLIVMSTHGYSGLRRWTMGSVSDRVVHLASLPVLVVRNPAPEPLTLSRLLVPLDGSAAARTALPLAIELAQRSQAALDLLTVVTPAMGLDPSLAPPSLLPEERPRLEARLLAELDEVRAQMAGIEVSPLVLEGFAADTICDTATRRGADLIVMAAHGYSGLRRWVLGSTADKVLHTSSGTPLLLVRAGAATGS